MTLEKSVKSNNLKSSSILRFYGHLSLRQRLLLSTISGKTIAVDKIRPADVNSIDDQTPGLADYEISFLRLLEKITNGSAVEISYTGTSLIYRPGVIIGGKIHHDCPNSRAIGYFLEPLVALAPFAKNPLNIVLTGITNDNVDPSVDTLRTVLLPQLKRYGIEDSLELKITKRGAFPLGGGEVFFRCPTIKNLKPIQLVDPGRIKRIRGIAYATRISPQMANRVVEAAKGILNRYIPDVYIYTDIYKGAESGKSPGYALTLVGESTNGCLLSAECSYRPRKLITMEDEKDANDVKTIELKTTTKPESLLQNDYTFPTPEDLGIRAARLLLQEIKKGGCIDTTNQWLAVLFAALGPEDVSKIRIGGLSNFTVHYLRDIKKFLGVTFNVKPDLETHTVLLSCLGIGYSNLNKKVN
ncbi:rRNA-processing endoribonuclease [Clydaea vesicula]|uniref:rRNA-processing endoribonuclease n=1 Tax=Clydaea vesicula TaxID=447962 RepID=A0AAD5TVV2_9FUNG|nr:rRNA-processing endoribonuclease [Clydaea vesicula]